MAHSAWTHSAHSAWAHSAGTHSALTHSLGHLAVHSCRDPLAQARQHLVCLCLIDLAVCNCLADVLGCKPHLLCDQTVQVITSQFGDGCSILQLGPQALAVKSQKLGCGSQTLAMIAGTRSHSPVMTGTTMTAGTRSHSPVMTGTTMTAGTRSHGHIMLMLGRRHLDVDLGLGACHRDQRHDHRGRRQDHRSDH